MKWWPFKHRDDPEAEPLPEDQPLWVLVDSLLAGRLPRDERAYIRVCVENWELRRENKDLRLQELHRRAAVNATMVHKPVPKPRPVRPRVNKRPAKRGVNKANRRSAYMREYMRKRRASPRLVSKDGVLTDGGDAA